MPVEALTFPLPRRNRTGPGSSLDLALQASAGDSLTPPRTRVIPFFFTVSGASRRTWSTPLLIGPAILRKMRWGWGFGQDPAQMTLELGWAATVLTEAGVPLTTVRPYTVLTELQNPFSVLAGAVGQGLPLGTDGMQEARQEISLDLIVTEPRFAFTYSTVNNGALASNMQGHMVILEAVNPDALANFTGS